MQAERRIYLDHAATSPLVPEALEAMLPYLSERFANPSSSHRDARSVRRALDDARDQLAEVLGAEPDEVVFTSGGTESDNLALKGAVATRPGPLLVSAIEHHAVLHAADPSRTRLAPVGGDGRIDPEALLALLEPETVLVSVMAANNETGVIQPLEEVAALVAAHAPEALLHTDAVQSFPALSATSWQKADLVSFSAHKFGGPKGVGALVVRRRARPHLSPLLSGGGQEGELRAGTENVAGIIGMAAAAGAAAARRPEHAALSRRRERLESGILDAIAGARVTGADAPRLPGIAHVVFPDVESEELLILLDDAGVAASAGAACAAGALEPSHVLLAMGRSESEARRAVRFSLGVETTSEEVERALRAVLEAHARLVPVGSARVAGDN